MKQTASLLLFFLLTITLHGQDKEQLIKKVCDEILISKTGSKDKECIRDEENDMTLSCFYIHSKPEWVHDFNGDGEDDVLVHFLDEGLGGGGNVFGYSYKLVLMKDGEINEIHDIFGGGKFSYGLLEVNKVEDGKIYATYEENPMSRTDYEDESPLRSVEPVFEYKDGKIVETSFLRCPIAGMDKRIFKNDIAYKVDRKTDMNDLFEEEQTERLYLRKNDEKDFIFATLSGCRNINLYFSHTIPYLPSIANDREQSRKLLLDFVTLLQENTRFSSTLKQLHDKIITNDFYEESYEGYILKATILLNNNWEANIQMNNYSYMDNNKRISTVIRLDKVDGKRSAGFWEDIQR